MNHLKKSKFYIFCSLIVVLSTIITSCDQKKNQQTVYIEQWLHDAKLDASETAAELYQAALTRIRLLFNL